MEELNNISYVPPQGFDRPTDSVNAVVKILRENYAGRQGIKGANLAYYEKRPCVLVLLEKGTPDPEGLIAAIMKEIYESADSAGCIEQVLVFHRIASPVYLPFPGNQRTLHSQRK